MLEKWKASVRLGRLVRGLSWKAIVLGAHEYEINLQPSSRRFLLRTSAVTSFHLERTMWFGNAFPNLHGSLLHFLQVVYRCVRWVFKKTFGDGKSKLLLAVGSFNLVIHHGRHASTLTACDREPTCVDNCTYMLEIGRWPSSRLRKCLHY